MENLTKVRELLGQTSQSIYPLARGVLQPMFEEYFTEQRFYVPTFIASLVSPKPISTALLGERTPYRNPDFVEIILDDAVEAGYLKKENDGNYVISDKGAKAISDVHLAFYNHVNEINQFPADKMKTLSSLLGKLVQACTESETAKKRVCLNISHNGHPKVEANTLAEIDQHLDDLNAFRDDAHIAAWKPVGVNGQIWETLSFVWEGENNTAAKLSEHLSPYRGYTEDDYVQALNDLAKRGWIEASADHYIVTADGKELRQEAELATDQKTFEPWKVISEDELAQLSELLTGLIETNQEILAAMPEE
ncbi:MAG: MarR family winged helix-turn-helix transcriptional regulator [Chloroflexota bacterium]